MTNAIPERVNILNEASKLIVGQRQQDYGTPDENFSRMADLVNVLIRRNLETNTPISPRQAAEIMILLKMARTVNSPTHDTYVDIAGYAGIAGELAESEKKTQKVDTFNQPSSFNPDSTVINLHTSVIDPGSLTNRIADELRRNGGHV